MIGLSSDYCVCHFYYTSYGQDSIPEKKNLKNTIRINLTNPMIFGTDCYMFGYERTIGNHQSFSCKYRAVFDAQADKHRYRFNKGYHQI